MRSQAESFAGPDESCWKETFLVNEFANDLSAVPGLH